MSRASASSTHYATEAGGCEQSDQSSRHLTEAAVPSNHSSSRPPSPSLHVSTTETKPKEYSPFSGALQSLHMSTRLPSGSNPTRLPRRATAPLESGWRRPVEIKRRPKRPLSAYNYFFNHECKQIENLLDSSNSTYSTCMDDDNGGPTNNAKRRKSLHDNPSVPDMGKVIIGRWKKLSDVERAKYEDLALIDSERYEREVEKNYKVDIPTRRLSTTSLPELKHRSMTGQGGGGALNTSMLPASSSSSSSPFDTSQQSKFGFSPYSMMKSNRGPSSPGSDKVSARLNENGKDENRSNKKTKLQALLAGRRNEMLSDIRALNELAAIKSARTSSSHSSRLPSTHQNDAGTMQRIFNLRAGGSSMLAPRQMLCSSGAASTSASSASSIPASITSTAT